MVDELGDSHASKRGKEDSEAVAVIDKLVRSSRKCGPKDRESIAKALDKVFKEKRPDVEGVPTTSSTSPPPWRWARWGPESATCCSNGSATRRTATT